MPRRCQFADYRVRDLRACQVQPAKFWKLHHFHHVGPQRGTCPLHGGTNGTAKCFSVNTKADTFHCFKCGRSGNALDLWAVANRLTPYDAALDLCQRLNIPLPLLAPPEPAN
ncbi:MAG: hypothetical protein EXS16_18770, partial [Gemmataceae bacterium]|nr:hypothetical protein [Gemmataceae bacterium]